MKLEASNGEHKVHDGLRMPETPWQGEFPILALNKDYTFQLECRYLNGEVFRVTKDGEIMRGDECITDNDRAIADCFRKWVEIAHGGTIKPRREIVFTQLTGDRNKVDEKSK